MMGFNVGQRGPSFLDLQLITNTDIEKASTYFTAGSVGYLFGSSICGLLYDKFNNNLLLFLSTFGLAVSVSVLPLCSPYVLMLVMSWANSFFMGWYDTVANADLVSIWGSEGQSYMQILHFSFAFGGMLSPLITEPFLASSVEDTFAAFIMTFVVMQLNWSKAQGSQITSVVWAAFAIMRFVGIFLIRYTTPVKLLFIFIVMSMLSLTGFLVCSHFAFSIGVWVFAALVGISVSTIFPTGVTWTNQALIKVTGKVTSSIIIACSIGSMINPVIIGYLMQELSPMWLCYLLLVQNIIYVVFFLILLYFAYVILIKVRCMKGTGNIDQNSDDSRDKNQCYVGIVTWM
ncbi:sodium-dependent glucose transporter 1-like [Patella vulgata]|uniref:sodium-dependent glucose transporter 1-like n=1 Tax=Patella vulgata TaxID=6465 RepID=UPI0024A956E9|nr:sodium-dependent glucose transporter 1-like [Patella vulgata]